MRTHTRLSETYTCYWPRFINIDGRETFTGVHGTHMSGKSNDDVGFLRIHTVPSLSFFPKGIENIFSNLIAIQISHSNIKTLNGNELDPFKKLTWLGITGHLQLERIPGNLFAKTRLMHTIWFNNNNIKQVGECLLASLTKLEYAHFGTNYCVNQIASTSGQISSLIAHLRSNCSDIEQPSTSTTQVITTTWTEEPTCCNVIYNLEEQNSRLKNKMEEIANKNREMNTKIDSMAGHNKQIDNLVKKNVEMSLNIESLKEKLSKLSQENSQIKQMLHEVLEKFLESSPQPRK